MVQIENFNKIIDELGSQAVLVAVSKTKPVEDIEALYGLGQKNFGENYVQELVEKYEALPKEIRWHFIGHLQSNKVKLIAPFVHLIHGVDSLSLLKEIDKQAAKANRKISCLLQMHIAQEETKFGFSEDEVSEVVPAMFPNIIFPGLMGMASFSDDEAKVRREFILLHEIFLKLKPIFGGGFTTLSMGMSSDYKIALQCGSNMVRIGSMLFGSRSPRATN